ncbi:hypothetical protein EHP00_1817 [Ecytonucleospora hepatopenaei]|uniref:t-SNARE coiled-coil homology domain-containing protein n=1 Tax=Ecytonucleospora hepatopenaei TaxID=646526 RepID=A0A1W0E2R3_9MICR|nr:hypothetical protein EHP00_2654 [Ecytonucleospora hepatopenaei]OQS53502.1 hypothetical protein EHP00_1817 [Ecytonucleospora hepatopenaei]
MIERTKEFHTIIESRHLRQKENILNYSFKNYEDVNNHIKSLFSELSKLTNYDKYKIEPILNEIEIAIDNYKNMQINEIGNKHQQEIYKNINETIQMRILRYRIKLKGIKANMTHTKKDNNNTTKKKNNLNEFEYQGMGGINTNKSNYSAVLQEEQQRSSQVNSEKFEQRRRIVNKINEMGEIVENISLHVSLQEMELRRIDDDISHSNHFGQKALNDLQETWNMVSEKRKTMIKFLVFWIFILITFYILKKK